MASLACTSTRPFAGRASSLLLAAYGRRPSVPSTTVLRRGLQPSPRRSMHTPKATQGGEQVCKDGVCYVDFSRREKPEASPTAGEKFDVAEHVKGLLDRYPVLVFSKTDCPYCDESKDILRSHGAPYKSVDLDVVENGEPIHAHLKEFTEQDTVPNIFIGKKHVGGCSDLKSLEGSGELKRMLKHLGF